MAVMDSLLRQRTGRHTAAESFTNFTISAPFQNNEEMRKSSPASSVKMGTVYRILLCVLLMGYILFRVNNIESTNKTTHIEWHWHHYSLGNSTGSNSTRRSLLIAQYTGLDEAYLEFTNITQRANRAYARRWSCDYLVMTGVVYDTGRPGQAAYNKLPLLKKAMDAKIYDAVLVLDSDAVIVDLDQDALDLIPRSMLLTACRNHVDDTNYTWNVNNGVTIWNLRHGKMGEVRDEWQRRVVARMGDGRSIPSDQAELHEVLKGYEEERTSIVNALYTMHFRFHEGTFVKHVVRGSSATWTSAESDLDRRKVILQEAVERVCTKWEGACDD